MAFEFPTCRPPNCPASNLPAPWFPNVPSLRSQKSDQRLKLYLSGNCDPTAHDGGASGLRCPYNILASVTFKLHNSDQKPVLRNSPPRINARQCALLAKKASETLLVVGEFEGIIRQQERLLEGSERSSITPYWNVVATELHQVLKAAESHTRDCCCSGGNWLKLEITQGNLKETFARLLSELEWHTWVLCSPWDETGNISNKKEKCDGNLRFTDNFLLCHVCDPEVCKPNLQYYLAGKLLEKLDAENRDTSGDLPTGRRLGSGAFALVRETEWLGQRFAQKAFFDSSVDKDFKDEIAAVIGLHHPNIVHVDCCSEAGPEDTELEQHDLSIVMELMYKSLYTLLHRDLRKPPFSIVQAADLILQIAEGLRYLHSRNLIHRGLKALNILKLDVYSFAIVWYEILTGDEPFADVLKTEVLARVKAGLRANLPDGVPGRLAVLMQECWNGDPLLRPNFAAICTELRFIKGLLLHVVYLIPVVTKFKIINIDGSFEYLAQIQGSVSTSVNLPSLTVVQTLMFHTNNNTYGHFGRVQEMGISETKFKSDYGRIVGYYSQKISMAWSDTWYHYKSSIFF
uniref:Protein kinase domain-containing protein n=1 Tax=Physcomitrium patens TaxID=3218 RepID=A0A2K1JFX2_PHYPA|nr:hypothetical protein PHYPA_017833 [Physcomitrium patens]